MKWRRNGGLYNVHDKNVCKSLFFHHHRFIYSTVEVDMNKSTTFQLLDVSTKWGQDKKLLLINTHLHSPNPFGHTSERKAQREEISLVIKSMTSGGTLYNENPVLKSIDWQNTGVLLVGDLNTAFETQTQTNNNNNTIVYEATPEYLETLQYFNARDLYLDNLNPGPKHKLTYNANNSLVAKFTVHDEARMDYVLAVDSIPCNSNGNGLERIPVMKLKALRCDIISPEHGNEHSDHYAYSFDVVPGDE
jgi:hypothetical protein